MVSAILSHRGESREHNPEKWEPVSRLRQARFGGRSKVGQDHAQGKSMSDIATATDAKLMKGPAFVRAKPLAPLPPPLTEAGAIGWMRKNLFSGPFNIALTVLSVLLIVWIVPPLVKFLVIDAVWNGASRADCLAGPDHPEMGACWAYVIDKISFFTYGF